ncbi:glutathione S-transferase family protein [filamentous cyanobacterium LEGE 11480]|uniref:Glutathione S-transferase family protein n=1 Tax=Romeriopsis navalis LEGE 11480 TaxID=2777977 RepID=A0A928VLT6_9CYAN|nr:glutathione S-transferase family protein [Romeriopsis navalis]MBE9030083.1 glutathione S-transferase family protein [Romeriopsis navalis LEGE 11480]
MLKFYYHPLSPLSRRVWLTLLEKQIPFETQEINLMGEQFQPEFLALNPFHHVPVIEDGDVRLIESFAIMDYLDAAYPAVKMTPSRPVALGQMRTIQMIVANELVPTIVAAVRAEGDFTQANARFDQMRIALKFLGEQLADRPFMTGETFTLADIVAGAAVPLFQRLGVALGEYGSLEAWQQRLSDRPTWQATHPQDADFERWQRYVKTMVKRQLKN